MIDLSKVTVLSLDWSQFPILHPFSSGCLIDLFQQASNIRSLTVHRVAEIMIRELAENDISSMIIQYVDPSKLRHLDIPFVDIDQFQRLLNRFTNLFSIRFRPIIVGIYLEKISAYVKTLLPGCSISYGSSSVLIWMD